MGQEVYTLFEMLERISSRDVYGDTLVELGKKREDVVVLTADLAHSNKTLKFWQAYPDRFFNVGIAEQNMMDISAGLALEGKMPYVSTMSAFASMRACEQIRTSICYPNLNVRIVATHGGLTAGLGATHYGQEDLAIVRSMPNMTVIAPGDPKQVDKILHASLDHKGPMYIRIGRGSEPVLYNEDYDYEIGKAIVIGEGSDITLIACGSAIINAVEAAKKLEHDYGISVGVIDMNTIKPLDTEAVLKAAKKSGAIMTVEDHTIIGGLGGAVSETLAEAGIGLKFKRLGIPDVFAGTGSPDELHEKLGYSADGVAEAVRELLK